ncbi:MAG: hypothetical protein EB127_06190, partial [Alphaproteobacteria bacterium]|nr:hypothetical protein [Alphaproteobacteria bacterium]
MSLEKFENKNDLKNKISSNIMGRKKSEITDKTSLNAVKTKLYNMIRTSKNIDGRSFQKYINQVAAIKNKEANRNKLMDLYDTVKAINQGEQRATYKKVAEVKAQKVAEVKLKNESATKITKLFKKRLEPVVEFKNLSKAKSHIEFNVDHIQGYDKLNLTELFPKLKDRVINEARKLMTIKNNIKLILGVNSTWSHPIYDDVTQPVKTKNKTVYSKAELNRVIQELFNELEELFVNMKHKQSNWSLKKIHYIFLESYDIKPVRGSSYIPTPEKYSNPKCGLINIKNDDQECFKWCMRYHQSRKAKNDDRITVLKKLEDKYNYDEVNFPAGYEDVKKFESNNEVSVFVYTISTTNEIIREHIGNPIYIGNDVIYLLRIGNEEKSHYVYIKHLSRLFNLNRHVSNTEGCWCPYCEKQQEEEDISNHIQKCYKLQFNDGALLKLPNKGEYMKFENHKNKLVRPFIIYADTESTLVPTGDQNKIQKHEINSCCCYFVCTFDSSRNKLFTFVGKECLEQMILTLSDIADNCIEEMKENKRMVMTKGDEISFYKASTCFLCNEAFDANDKKLVKVRDHDHL